MHFLAILISYVLAGSEAWGGVRRSATPLDFPLIS
jgi:hypothetical protein